MPARINPSRAQRRTGGSHTLFGLTLLAVAVVYSAHLVRSHAAPPAPITEARFVAEYDTVNIPVPARAVPAGTRVRDIPLVQMTYPLRQLPEGALRSLAGLENAVTLAPLPANLPFF